MANILVLGGSGFVSEALSKYLIRRGYSIDILTRGKKKIDRVVVHIAKVAVE